ncbi:hypothetical protein CDD82_6445 [Ophiocordyceps australis]|uniref:NADH dehydrogenase [ubiquinone] 1 alpha subcomplex subunit 1 n=1 Tax=Ophiocordyceps australis TaxID=1399860 RepID=A0A2C5YPV7_9HYPO|nr:hypothetical protein CDD82_6445 [Ophiocordyceps australis]
MPLSAVSEPSLALSRHSLQASILFAIGQLSPRPNLQTRLAHHHTPPHTTTPAAANAASIDPAMPVPFEALLPYAIMVTMFGITGTGLAVVKTWANDGKRPRYSLDYWDKVGD